MKKIVERKLEDLLLAIFPVLDRADVLMAEALLGIDGPTGLKAYDLDEMGSTAKLGVIVILFDPGIADVLDLIFGWYPLKKYEKTPDDDEPIHKVDPLNGDYEAERSPERARQRKDDYHDDRGLPVSWLKYIVIGAVFLFIFGGIIASVFGVGGQYLGFGVEQVQDSTAGGVEQVGDAGSVLDRAIQQVSCLAAGPGCLRAGMNNQSQRPGSKDVGEKFGLKIQEFRVGSGDKIDVSYSDPDRVVPLGFRVTNPMKGRKGIDAENVAFRIKMIDSERGVNNPYCDTGWLDLGNSDMDNDGKADDIRAGTTSGTGFVEINSNYITENNFTDIIGKKSVNYEKSASERAFNLRNCEMMQTALGETRKIHLKIRYDYFSQARVKFEAMSRDYMLKNDIPQPTKASETADTPVQAVVNVKSPVTFTVGDNGERRPNPFGVSVTLESDSSDVEYMVNDLDLLVPRVVERTGQSCNFDFSEEGRIKNLNEDSRDRIIYNPDLNRGTSFYWHSKGDKPAIMGCFVRLKNESSVLQDISRSGETFVFRALSNYTVSKRKKMDQFGVNAKEACSQIECPRIATLNVDSSKDYNFKTHCGGIDASYEGCSAIDGGLKEFSKAQPETNKPYDANIEEGEIAVNLEKAGISYSYEGEGKPIAGFEKDEWEKIDPDMDGELGGGDIKQERFVIVRFRNLDDNWDTKLEGVSESKCKKGEIPSIGEQQEVIYSTCGGSGGQTGEQSSDQSSSGSEQSQESGSQPSGPYTLSSFSPDTFEQNTDFDVTARVETSKDDLSGGDKIMAIQRKRLTDGSGGDSSFSQVKRKECRGGSGVCAISSATVDVNQNTKSVKIKVNLMEKGRGGLQTLESFTREVTLQG